MCLQVLKINTSYKTASFYTSAAYYLIVIDSRHVICFVICFEGAAVAEWLSYWLAEQDPNENVL